MITCRITPAPAGVFPTLQSDPGDQPEQIADCCGLRAMTIYLLLYC